MLRIVRYHAYAFVCVNIMSSDLSKNQSTMFHVLSMHCALVITGTLITRLQDF